MAARLAADRPADIETGTFNAGEGIDFSLEPYGDKYILRFAGEPEAFVLSEERVILGGRELKYDTGATALRVSVWGSMTLYTEATPGGLPATRTGDYTPPPYPSVSPSDLAAALHDEASHMAYEYHVALRFAAPVENEASRAEAFNALPAIAGGIARVVSAPGGHETFARRIDAVKMVEGDRPACALSGRTLLVNIVPSQGLAGHPSSRAIAVALGKFLSIPEAD